MHKQAETSDIKELIVYRKKKNKKVAKEVSYVQSEMVIGKYFILPIKLECATNKREAWYVTLPKKRAQRYEAKFTTLAAFPFRKVFGKRFVITITRYGLRKMDDDNLATSAKYVRDGIADALGIDDGDSRIKWEYKQEIGKAYGCKVQIRSSAIEPHVSQQ